MQTTIKITGLSFGAMLATLMSQGCHKPKGVVADLPPPVNRSATGDVGPSINDDVCAGDDPCADGDPGITTRELSYRADIELKGFLAYPNDGHLHPGILVVPEWWGLTDYPRSRARQLAELGYTAFAVDMFGDGASTIHADTATKFARESMRDQNDMKRLAAAAAVLREDRLVSSAPLVAIGYCYGGGVVLRAARTGMPLALVASFHGTLATDAPLKKGVFSGKIFVATGERDELVPLEQVRAFEEEMTAANADFQVVTYPNAKHAFTNPGATELGARTGLPLAYDRQADLDSWRRLVELLGQLEADETVSRRKDGRIGDGGAAARAASADSDGEASAAAE